MIFLIVVAVLVLGWWLLRLRSANRIASRVMKKWIATGTTAKESSNTRHAAHLLGKWESLPEFRFQYEGLPSHLKVTVTGTGRYLGFRGDITEEGMAVVWYEKGSGSRVKRLVEAISTKFPGVINGNDYPANVHHLYRRSDDTSAAPQPG